MLLLSLAVVVDAFVLYLYLQQVCFLLFLGVAVGDFAAAI